MRPVERGDAPQTFSDYRAAKPFLVNRLGDYCSYCERPIKTNLAVEHVRPKNLYPELREDWGNFLLGCVNCNSTKSDKDVSRDKVLLPDQDNTFLAYVYTREGQVLPNPQLGDVLQKRAEATLALTGLDKFPDEFDTDASGSAALERWQQRSRAWQDAQNCFHALSQNDSEEIRKLIIVAARNTGFFSVWMIVFKSDPIMLQAFIQEFPGTSPKCFDTTGSPINRPGGHL
ncbi:hypothetical protein C1752_03287 [Acaryochloris thomasi RCC1774]|uniref:HNH domain-containing protein n=1 Tax=Acaryochloris thomasi RCC1774 TaxID=1764569 RepID=A0A2W1JGV7_9CYAN|nr:HNH endonuclease [Acaryochloris thomasi]PZD72820.1 hypothetical protein C1752_03287 [Acaryochloris thomasi RCC1774]